MLRLFSNKRGQEETPDLILTIAELILVLIAITILTIFVQKWVKDTTFEKNYIARDVAVLADTIYAAPSDVYFTYKYDEHNFMIAFDDKIALEKLTRTITSVQVNDKKDELEKKDPEWYQFAKNGNMPISVTGLKLKDGINITKKEDKLSVGEKLKSGILRLECLDVPSSSVLASVLIDAGHGDGKGYSDGSIVEGNIVGGIAEGMKASANYQALSSRNVATRLNQEDVFELAKKASVIVGLHVGSYESETNIVRIYYSIKADENVKERSQKLACLILNRFSEKYASILDGVSIVPIYPEDYDNVVLPKDVAGIIIEIGNIKSKKGKELLGKTLSTEINEGLGDYLGKIVSNSINSGEAYT